MKVIPLKEAPSLFVTKWLKLQMLVDTHEMAELLEFLGNFSIYTTSAVCKEGSESISKKQFIESYAEYVAALKSGILPDRMFFTRFFSKIFTTTNEILYAIEAGKGERIVKASRPVIQLQAHNFDYSPFDGKFRSMIFGSESILWGIQFSYPQIFQHPGTQEIEQIGVSDEFPNTQLFRHLQKWMREFTVPTPFIIEGKKINVPIRLGKQCFSWINSHPQFLEKGLKVC